MLELFLNTVTREWYDKDGNPFRDGMPRGAYQSREDVKITLCKETPSAGAAGVDVSTWKRDASLASVSGVGAMLTIDSDRIHKLKGELSGEVSAGAVSTITATIENASNATVPESGTLRLFDESGDYEAIAYTDRSIVDGEATFTVSGSVSGSYAVGSVIDCDQSPYAQTYLDTLSSNLEQGELVFHLVIDSQRLRAEMDYSDVETLSIAGLELLIYQTADGASDPITAYLCETYSVTGTLGSVGNEAQPPDATADKLAGLVDQLLAAGLDVEQQYDSEGNTQFRVRSVSAGGTWSDWITVQKGEPGADGKSFSIDATGLMSERTQYDAEAAGFSFLATDEGNLYIKNSDTSGDWSDAIPFQGPAGADGAPGPANTLTIGTVTTGEPGTQASASITGEAPNQVLNLTIPKGDKGDPGDGGSGSGDMLKSVYDTNDDGKVDEADQADSALNIGGKTAAQVATAVDNSHTHANKTTLDKLGESGGKLTFNGSEVGGGTAASVAWDDVTGKPSTFPPSDHVHEISDVNSLQSALDAKGTVKSVNGVEPDSSGNVTIENGAFPDSAVDGDVMMMQEGVDRGNGESTVFLLQPSTSDGELIDSAYGASTTAQITNTGLTVAENGNIQFTPSTYGVIKGGTLPADVFVPDHEWTLDILFKLDSEQSNNYAVFFGHESSGYSFWAQVKNGDLQFLSTDILYCNAGKYTFGEWALLTVEYYYDETAAAWKHSAYQNGVLGSTSARTLKSGVRNKDLYIGRRSSGNYYCTGEISVIRVRNTAPYRGKSFTPDDTPYLTPEKAAVPVNMESKISDAVAAHNSSLNAHPMQFSGETDFNNLTQGGSFYLSAGSSLQNAPATGTFFVIIKNWTSGDITRIFQQVYRLQPDGVHRFYTRHGNKASGAAGITWSSWMMIGYNAFISAPKYNSGTNVTSSYTSGGNSYTCSSSGWMYLKTGSGGSYTINGGTVVSADASGTASVCVPVKSGDVVSGSAAGTLIFYPQE